MNQFPLFRIVASVSLLLAPPLAAQQREDAMAFGPNIEKEDYFRAGIAPVRAPAGYDLTIVYFMDYQCPSCRRYTPDVARVLAEDKRVRVIYRDTPIISDLSTVAARAAIAASFQGRHEPFHHALMMTKGQLTEAAIRAAAKTARVDWARLQRDLKSRGEDIDLQIGRNVELAVETGIMGTPAFIVGERLSNGALDYASLKAEIADARAAAGKVAAASPAKPPPEAPPSAVETTRATVGNTSIVAAPLFTQPDPRPPSADITAPEASKTTGLPSPIWVAVLAAIGGLIGGWWFVRRRRAAGTA